MKTQTVVRRWPTTSRRTVGWLLQTYLERMMGQSYMLSQEPIRFWMFVVFLHGLIVVAGAFVTIKHLLTLQPAPQKVDSGGDAGS